MQNMSVLRIIKQSETQQTNPDDIQNMYQDYPENDKQQRFEKFSIVRNHKSRKQNHDTNGIAAFDDPDKEIFIDGHFYGGFGFPGCKRYIIIEYFQEKFWMIGDHFRNPIYFKQFCIILVQVPLIKYNQYDIRKQELAQEQQKRAKSDEVIFQEIIFNKFI